MKVKTSEGKQTLNITVSLYCRMQTVLQETRNSLYFKTKKKCHCHICTGFVTRFNFPAASAAYKHGCQGLLFPTLPRFQSPVFWLVAPDLRLFPCLSIYLTSCLFTVPCEAFVLLLTLSKPFLCLCLPVFWILVPV